MLQAIAEAGRKAQDLRSTVDALCSTVDALAT